MRCGGHHCTVRQPIPIRCRRSAAAFCTFAPLGHSALVQFHSVQAERLHRLVLLRATLLFKLILHHLRAGALPTAGADTARSLTRKRPTLPRVTAAIGTRVTAAIADYAAHCLCRQPCDRAPCA